MVKHRRKLIIPALLTLCLAAGRADAQSAFGLSGTRYAGVYLADVNPSRMMRDNYFLQFTLGSAHAYFRNNYIYLPAHRLRDLRPDFRLNMLSNQVLEDVYTPQDKYAHIGLNLKGPSFFRSWGTLALGAGINHRTALSADHVDFHVAKFVYEGTDYSPQHNIPFLASPYDLAGLQWTEFNLSGAGIIYMKGKHEFFWGATVKALMAEGGFYLQNRLSDYEVLNDSMLVVDDFLAGIGYALPMDYHTNAADFSDGLFRGYGAAFTAGLSYYRYGRNADSPGIGEPCETLPPQYVWMLGLSVGDIGFATLNKKAETHFFDHRPTAWERIDDFRYHNIRQFTHEISYHFYGDSLASARDDAFRVWLPSFVNLQTDIQLFRRLYLYASLQQGLLIGEQRLHHPSMAGIMPHWEKDGFGISLPVTLYQWQIPGVGLSLHYKGFTLGSDNLLGWAGFGNITGFDFYLSLGFGFEKSYCLVKKGDRRYRKLKFGRIPCPRF